MKKIFNFFNNIYINLKLKFLIFYSKIILKKIDTITGERLKGFISLITYNKPSCLKSKEMAIIYIEHFLKYIYTNYSFGKLFSNIIKDMKAKKIL